MIKVAYIFLPVLISFHSFALIGQTNNADSDTVNEISIRVTVAPKPLTASSNKKKLTNQKHKKVTGYWRPKNKQTSEDSILKSKRHNNHLSDSISAHVSRKDTMAVKVEKEPIRLKHTASKSNTKKDIYFLLSLFLIITGTLLAVFYRSGIPLAIVILLLVAGYYILIYSLLFMA